METVLHTEPEEIHEEILVARLVQRDESALAEIYSAYRPVLMGVITKVTHDPAEGEDILQEVVLQAWERIGTYEATKGKFKSWITTIARRRAIDHVRRACAYRRTTDRFEVETRHENVRKADENGNDVSTNDVRNLIDRQLDLLPVFQREAVSMAYLEGRSQREIAAMTHTSLGTVKTRIELGMKKLTRGIADLRTKIL